MLVITRGNDVHIMKYLHLGPPKLQKITMRSVRYEYCVYSDKSGSKKHQEAKTGREWLFNCGFISCDVSYNMPHISPFYI